MTAKTKVPKTEMTLLTTAQVRMEQARQDLMQAESLLANRRLALAAAEGAFLHVSQYIQSEYGIDPSRDMLLPTGEIQRGPKEEEDTPGESVERALQESRNGA